MIAALAELNSIKTALAPAKSSHKRRLGTGARTDIPLEASIVLPHFTHATGLSVGKTERFLRIEQCADFYAGYNIDNTFVESNPAGRTL